jgi:hypothetical protein
VVASGDEWFRPVGMTLGPDGAVYIVDWYNKIISHNEVARNHPDRDKKRGRIWRLKGAAQKGFGVPDFTKMADADLVAKLGSPAVGQAHMAWQTLSDRAPLTPATTAALEAKIQEPAAAKGPTTTKGPTATKGPTSAKVPAAAGPASHSAPANEAEGKEAEEEDADDKKSDSGSSEDDGATFDEGLGGAGLAAAPAKARGASAAGRSIVASFPVSTTAPHAAAGAIGDGSRGVMSPRSDTTGSAGNSAVPMPTSQWVRGAALEQFVSILPF